MKPAIEGLPRLVPARGMRFGAGCLVLASLAMGAACWRRGPAGEPTAAPWLAVASGARLYSDNAGGIQDSVRTVVRDEATLRQLWGQATTGQATPPSIPRVDFAREMVLVVAAGRKTPRDEIRVDSVRVRRETDASGRTQEVMSAMVRTIEGCGRFSAPAYPVEIVRVRRFDGRVTFTEQRDKATC
jgi:hypothetical protein